MGEVVKGSTGKAGIRVVYSTRGVRWAAPFLFALAMGNAVALASHDSAPRTATPSAGPAELGSSLPPLPESASSAVPSTAPRKPAKTRAGTTSTTTGRAADEDPLVNFPVMADGYGYEVLLTPACARPGERLTATLKMPPKWGAAGVVMPFYSDGTHEEGRGAIAEPDGTITYSWVARPIFGEGRLVTRAQDPDTSENGQRILKFVVVRPGQSC